jgi:5-hydroxyisourate hydrolase-like protein (transthyretin family)
MLRRTITRICLLLVGLGLAGTLLSAQTPDTPRARKYKVPPPASRIEVTVLRDVNGKPVENAAVIFHPIEGDRDKGIMELKTNEDGKCVIDVIPIGDTVRMQIIARGFQTTGQDFKVDKDALKFEVRLKRPGEQFSVYKAHPEGNGEQTPPADTPAPAPDKPATPPTAK